MLPTYGLVQPYITKGLVSDRPHPENDDIRILNYSQTCQFEHAWDDVTRACRGLVLNRVTGDVLANPFPKFFNYQEHVQKEWPIPDETPIISEKLDGSLGILVFVGGRPWIATRGSFNSEQAQWATAWWRKHMPGSSGDNAVTHLFEIVYAQNRIVVKYDYEGLVYLGSRMTQTGEHVDCRSLFEGTAVRLARHVPSCDLSQLATMDEPNSEGFVVHYPTANVRLKIKFAEYVRLHKLVTGLSEIAIWERMRDGKTLDDLIEKVPDEFFQFVIDTQNKIQAQYDIVEAGAKREFGEAVMAAIANGKATGTSPDRKAYALQFQKKKYRGICFSMFDERPYADAIWKEIRPRGQSAFATDPDA